MNHRTIPQVAKELKVSADTVTRKARQQGRLTAKLGTAWVLTPEDVEAIRLALRGK